MSDSIDNKCKTCNKLAPTGNPLKSCSRCKSIQYCSRDCQKADWKSHKKICASNAQARADSGPQQQQPGAAPGGPIPSGGIGSAPVMTPTDALNTPVEQPFHKLHAKKWMHDRSEEDVYKLLIDTYRLRVEDDYNLAGEVDEDSIYSGRADGRAGFRRFLKKVERKRGLLPDWWSPEKANACVALGTTHKDYMLAHAVEKHDVVQQYGNPLMPMQLRMFGEQVYGSGPGGQSGGARMMQIQMMAEQGGGPSITTLDTSSMFR